jgi:ubiquinone biosynthesis protein COQ4
MNVSEMKSQNIKRPGFLTALRAIRRLLADKEDTAQVFTILEALGQRSSRRTWKRFSAHPDAPQIMQGPTLISMLTDRDALQALPEGSLGRSYYEFTTRENISADELVEASNDGFSGTRELSDDEAAFHQRQRDAHDLWHVLTGYGRDPLGELCLLAVSHSHLGNPGFLMIILFGGFDVKSRQKSARIWSSIFEGFRNGRRMTWLPTVDWAEMLALPLDEVRRRLNVPDPSRYQLTRKSVLGTDSQTDTPQMAAE